MEAFPFCVVVILASCATTLTQTVSNPRVVFCQTTKYCPNYTKSCLDLYRRENGSSNYQAFNNKYPCCVVSSKFKNIAICARGGVAAKNIIVTLGSLTTSTNAIITPFSAGFREKIGVCLESVTDCEDSFACRKECKRLGVEGVNSKYECCYCGPPLGDECDNCYCGREVIFEALSVTVSVNVSVSPIVAFPVSIPLGVFRITRLSGLPGP